ncbi:integrase, catalytic region, zinc finger, CCHC-type containing protein [Tanacetum coccineum]
MQMEPYESFSCRCERGDVVLRKSHKPHSFGKLYYACPRLKPSKQDHRCGYFKWKDEITFGNASSFPEPLTPSISSSRTSSFSGLSGAALSPGNVECSNCKILTMKIKILKARLAMERHPEDYACQSPAILHELLDEMENLRVE